MTNSNNPSLSRRDWLGFISKVSVGTTLLAGSRAAAEYIYSSGKNPGDSIYNVRDFGAKGDGKTLDTDAIQAAIDACAKENGGIVLVPAGDFLVGTLQLKSNITLHLAAQGRLLGSAHPEPYSEGKDVPRDNGAIALLYASKADNIAIEGRGTIDGQGAEYLKIRKETAAHGRPHLVIFSECTNVALRDVFLTNCAFHCIRFLNCKYVRIDGIRIYNRGGANNDGFHFNSAQYVHISNCDVVCGDDACALFGSCQFVTVTNCTFSTRWSIFRFGGGDARNITVSNCVIYETYGCPIKMACRAGSHYEDMVFSNLIFKDVTGPVSLGLDPEDMSGGGGGGDLPRATPAAPHDAIIRNIAIDGIRGTVVTRMRPLDDQPRGGGTSGETRQCIVLNGVHGGVLENITISNVHLRFEGGGTTEEAKREVPQIAGEYFRIGTPPAYGLYARNVRGLTVGNVRFETANPDLRPAMLLDHVTDVAVNGFSAQGNKQAESLLRFLETSDALLTGSRVLSPAAVFLQVEGTGSKNITVDGGDLSKVETPVSLKAEASKESVKLRI